MIIRVLFLFSVVIASLNTVNSAQVGVPAFINDPFYAKASAGVYEKDHWIVVIATVPVTSRKQAAIHYEGKAMLQTQALLKKHVLKNTDLSVFKQHGFHGRLAIDLNTLIDSGRFYQFSLNAISTRLIENRVINKQHRRVTLLNKDELAAPRMKVSVAANQKLLINALISAAQLKANNALLAEYYFDLGLIREAYYYKIQQLNQHYYLVNYPAIDTTPFQSRHYLRQILASSPDNLDVSLLKKLPANPELFAQLKKQLDASDRLGKSLLDLLLMPALAEEDRAAQFDKVNQAIDYLTPARSIVKELSLLKNSKHSSADLTLPDIVTTALQQQGFLIIDKSYRADSNTYFVQAKSLFAQGRAINTVIELLYKSIKASPRHAQSWVYLGSALKYKKQYMSALACFQQASLLDHNDLETQANIADIYLQLKQFSLAQAYLYYLQPPDSAPSTYVKKVINQIHQIKENQ